MNTQRPQLFPTYRTHRMPTTHRITINMDVTSTELYVLKLGLDLAQRKLSHPSSTEYEKQIADDHRTAAEVLRELAARLPKE